MIATPASFESADDRLSPPSCVEAEVEILGGILYDPTALERVVDLLPPDAFYLTSHKVVYRACLALRLQEQPIDLMSVTQFLQGHGQLDRVGGKLALVNLLDSVVSTANIDHMANLVADKWRRRRLGQLGRKLVDLQHSSDQWGQLYEAAEADLSALALDQQQGGLQLAADIQLEIFSEIERRASGEMPPGIPTEFYDLDGITQGGLQRGDLVIVAGRPSMGKTALCLAVAKNIAARGLAAACFSLEMSGKQLVYRLLSELSEIEAGRLRAGRIAAQEWEKLGHATSRVSGLPLYIDDAPQPSIAHIRSQCRKLKAQHGDLGLVFIDYLQLMDCESDNRVQELAKLTRKLKGLARELDCPVIALSQLSRAVESRTNKRPMMSDLRESGGLEQDADLILMLYREEYYEPDTAERGIAEVIVSKQRNGPTGTVKLLFEPQFNRFKSIARGTP